MQLFSYPLFKVNLIKTAPCTSDSRSTVPGGSSSRVITNAWFRMILDATARPSAGYINRVGPVPRFDVRNNQVYVRVICWLTKFFRPPQIFFCCSCIQFFQMIFISIYFTGTVSDFFFTQKSSANKCFLLRKELIFLKLQPFANTGIYYSK